MRQAFSLISKVPPHLPLLVLQLFLCCALFLRAESPTHTFSVLTAIRHTIALQHQWKSFFSVEILNPSKPCALLFSSRPLYSAILERFSSYTRFYRCGKTRRTRHSSTRAALDPRQTLSAAYTMSSWSTSASDIHARTPDRTPLRPAHLDQSHRMGPLGGS